MNNGYYLVLGLGSMGKRRVRNLLTNKRKNIIGIDEREDRRNETENLYGIKTLSSLDHLDIDVINQIVGMLVCLPPHKHDIGFNFSLKNHIPCFVEASVLSEGLRETLQLAKEKNITICPSCTLHFHPAVQIIKSIVESKELGEVTNVIHTSGQYLPDWHSYEKVSEYYVSRKETGGAREIVPFELTWLTKIFGFPESVNAIVKKTIVIEGAEEIDDTYNILFEFPKMIMNLNVDVVSRRASRLLFINLEVGQIRWDWEKKYIEIFNGDKNTLDKKHFELKESSPGYNPNISDTMYVHEIEAFINSIEDPNNQFPNSLEEDIKVLQLLEFAEEAYKKKKTIFIQ